MSKPDARLATSLPMEPSPTIPRVESPRSTPRWRLKLPARITDRFSYSFREHARISPMAYSATARLFTPGLEHTAMPLSVAAGTSTES